MIDRVSDRADFDRFRTDGVRSRGGPVTMVRVDRPHAQRPAVAFAISRKVGSAVTRNRLRRQLRALFRSLANDGRLGTAAWLVIPGPHAAGSSTTTLSGWVEQALARSGTERG